MKKKWILGLVISCLIGWAVMGLAGTDEPTISNAPAVWPQYYNGTSFKHPRVDSSTRATATIDYAHHEIHAGDSFLVSGATSIGSGATVCLLMAAPNTTRSPHVTLSISSSGVLSAYLLENVVLKHINANLTSGATPYNHDRNSATTSGCTLGWVPNWSSPYTSVSGTGSMIGNSGTTLYYVSIGSNGVGGSSLGGTISRDTEIILKSGTTYALLISSGTAGNQVGYALQWYEHSPETK
jgi:hypothetical protein